MTGKMPNAQFIAIAILILLLNAWILIRYARACLCDSCKDPYAIFGRGELQLCRQCKIVYDRHRPKRPRPSLFRRFRRGEDNPPPGGYYRSGEWRDPEPRRNFNVNPFGTKYANRDDRSDADWAAKR